MFTGGRTNGLVADATWRNLDSRATPPPRSDSGRLSRMPSPLPIDEILPQLLQAMQTRGRVVLEAPPGAGKTTRVPQALLARENDNPGQIVITEPRRLAARLAASFVASEMGVSLGGRVGYSVRFEDKTSAETRIRYVTEGVLLRQLEDDPQLAGVSCVILDEFHERHLATDQLLALLVRLRKTRPELELIVMSATLDAAPIATFLGDCPKIRSEGRAYPLTIEHDPQADERPLERRVASAIRELTANSHLGDVLVFLPGAREIRQCKRLLEERAVDFEIHELHGELPIATQAAAVRRGSRRKIVLATNVAESSVTIDGVTAVIDSGLARVASTSLVSGRPTLELAPICQKSAIQRAGRAGRTGPGRVRRLYTEADFRRRPADDQPEIQRLELSEMLLRLRGMGLSCTDLPWLAAPPEQRVIAAETLLERLQALTGDAELTPVGRRMIELGMPVRIARMLVSAERLGVVDHGCAAAALLSERDIRLRPRQGIWDLPSGPSDVEDRIDAIDEANAASARRQVLRAMGLDPGRFDRVTQLERQLRKRVRNRVDPPDDPNERQRRLRRALLHGYCDRVARHQADQGRLIFEDGSTAQVSPYSVVRHEPLVVALEEEERSEHGGRAGRVQWMSAIEADWLLDDYPERIQTTEALTFDTAKGRVESVESMAYGSVVLDQSSVAASPSAAAGRLLFDAAIRQRAMLFGKDSKIEELACRIELLRQHGLCDDLPAQESLTEEAILRDSCADLTSLAELREVNWEQRVLFAMSSDAQRSLREHTPTELSLPGGRRVSVTYENGKPPWIASRLQDFFGMQRGPTICRDRQPLTLHLLAPNGRAVQVTSDLGGFWTRHYAEVRKELRRRYVKHAWPEDGATATPPAPRPPRPRPR